MIYLDNSATTAICPSAAEKMITMIEKYGNPSSRHALGMESRREVEQARKFVGAALGIPCPKADEMIFTSGGTEANNLAIFGSVYAKKRRMGAKIITTDSEHASISRVMDRLENEGFKIVRVPTREGVLDYDFYLSELDESTALVSLMMVNNETGAVYDVKKFFDAAKKKNPDVITHCDAIQGFLKIKFTPKGIGADLVSISAHKVHGPKGIGALYVSPTIVKSKKLVPHMLGGGQESGFRSGTENLLGIVGFGEAALVGTEEFTTSCAKMTALRDLCAVKVIEAGARVNAPREFRAPHILSVTLPSIKSETMLNFLSSKGICVSAGSACSSHSRNISSSLVGFGLSPYEADTTIRISFCAKNTEEEIEIFASTLKDGIDTLVRIRK